MEWFFQPIGINGKNGRHFSENLMWWKGDCCWIIIHQEIL